MSSVASADTMTLALDTVDAFAGAVMTTAGAVRSLSTFTVTVAAAPVPPLVSLAMADRKCWPLGTVIVPHEIEYGLDVSSAPRLTPSRTNCTPAIVPLPAVGVAETVTTLETVDPFEGAVIVAVVEDPPPPVFSAVAITSKFVVPCVHTRPI